MSWTQRRSMHVNSLAAYEEGRVDMFSAREIAILAALRRLKCATDRGVMLALNFTDMNSVRPRITELIKDGVLMEDGSVDDHVTGKRVRAVRFRPRPQVQVELPLEDRRAS